MPDKRWRVGVLVVAAALTACDPPPPRQDPVLRVAKGDNALDEVIRKASLQDAGPPAARFELSPAALDFPPVEAGAAVSRSIELVNAGGAGAPLTQLRIAGQSSTFRLGGGCVDGMEIPPAGRCSMTVTFMPQLEGPASAELVVIPGGGGPLFLPLTGVARAAGGKPAAAPPSTPNAEASLAFLRSRRAAGLALDSGPAPDPAAAAVRPIAADYTDAGLPGVVSGFPVDRRRVITADRYIPAVLENDIDSQLPGRTIAVVESNVYGAEGRLVLIPAGSRVIGSWRAAGAAGQARLEIGWTRIIRPDGATINIDDLSADVMGRSGLPGDLDNRLWEKYGGSLMTSVVAAAGDWVLGGNATSVVSPLGGTAQTLSGQQRAADRLGNDLDDLGRRLIQDNIDIRPVLQIAAGTRLNIIPGQDLWLQDPQHLRAVTPPRAPVAGRAPTAVAELLPGLIELAAQNPALQRLAPQSTQQVLQSTLLQQLRERAAPQTPAAEPPRPTGAGGPAP